MTKQTKAFLQLTVELAGPRPQKVGYFLTFEIVKESSLLNMSLEKLALLQHLPYIFSPGPSIYSHEL